MEVPSIEFEDAPPISLAEMQAVPTFADLSPDGLAWMASQMQAIDLRPGQIASYPGASADHMVVVLSGEIRAEREDGRVFIARAGQVTGLLPFSRLTHYPSMLKAAGATRMGRLHKDHFAEMVQRMPPLQTRLVSLLTDRVRESAASDQQREKIMALGRLSAGLAHELNNPASAARRAADNLLKALKSVRKAALKLDREGLPLESRVFLTQLEDDWAKNTGPQAAMDTLDRSDREEELSGWLEAHKLEAVWDLATTLVDVGCTLETLESVVEHVPEKFLNDVLIRLTAVFNITRLAEEIESSTGRISELVRVVKEYSYMDQMPQQQIDVHQGLENTLLMLRHRLKDGIEIVRDYDRSLPEISAHGSELNQIWTNLIVNAADAMNGNGKLVIRTLRDGKCIRVEVIDNGPGIPDNIKSKIFDPFFTTKAFGEGTGLGLDIVSRIVRNHGGNISFESRPGETCFVVRIPFDTPVEAAPVAVPMVN